VLREEKAYKVRVLSRIFGSKTDEVTQSWENFINCTLHQILLKRPN